MPSLLINLSNECPSPEALTYLKVWAIREAIADGLADGAAAARAGASREDVNDVRKGRYDHVPRSRWDRRLAAQFRSRLPVRIEWR